MQDLKIIDINIYSYYTTIIMFLFCRQWATFKMYISYQDLISV